MKVLVTGATGFIGRHVVAELLKDPTIEVVAASRRASFAARTGLKQLSVDLLVPGAPARLIAQTLPTHLVHLAWNVAPGQFWTARDNLDWAGATLALTRAFVEAGGARAVLAGTCAEYDWSGEGLLREDAPLMPSTFYGQVKDATRRAVCAFGAQTGVPIAWGRVFWLYGPGEPSGRLVSDVARALTLGAPVETGEGTQRRDFLHVSDVAGAFVKALASDWAGPFNIGSGDAVPVRRVVETLAAVSGRPELVRFGARLTPPGEPPLLVADVAVLRDVIGYTPRRTLEEGLASVMAHWSATGRTAPPVA